MPKRIRPEQQLLEKAARYLPGASTGNTSYPDSLKFLAREGRGSRI